MAAGSLRFLKPFEISLVHLANLTVGINFDLSYINSQLPLRINRQEVQCVLLQRLARLSVLSELDGIFSIKE